MDNYSQIPPPLLLFTPRGSNAVVRSGPRFATQHVPRSLPRSILPPSILLNILKRYSKWMGTLVLWS